MAWWQALNAPQLGYYALWPSVATDEVLIESLEICHEGLEVERQAG